jgi:hypothetical protein
VPAVERVGRGDRRHGQAGVEHTISYALCLPETGNSGNMSDVYEWVLLMGGLMVFHTALYRLAVLPCTIMVTCVESYKVVPGKVLQSRISLGQNPQTGSLVGIKITASRRPESY